MERSCPTCKRLFVNKNALNQHTGTSDKSTRGPHACPKCDSIFCSQQAMEQHRDHASHRTMFSCSKCKRTFESKQAVAQHEKSSAHKNYHEQGHENDKVDSGFASVLHYNGAVTTLNVPPVPSADPRAFVSNTVQDSTNHDKDVQNSTFHDSDEDEETGEEEGYDSSYDSSYDLMDDFDFSDPQDHTLCDKDCGWCGRCAEGKDF